MYLTNKIPGLCNTMFLSGLIHNILFASDDDSTPHGFPEEICELTNLRYLNLESQGIVHVPDSIQKLTNLEVLTIKNNPHLLSLSAQVGLLPLKSNNTYMILLVKTKNLKVHFGNFVKVFWI